MEYFFHIACMPPCLFCLTVLYVILHLGTAPSAVRKLLHPTRTWTLFLSTSLPLVGARSLCLYSSTPVQAKLHLNVLFTPLWFSFCWDIATPCLPSPLSSDEALIPHTKPPLCSYVLFIFFWLWPPHVGPLHCVEALSLTLGCCISPACPFLRMTLLTLPGLGYCPQGCFLTVHPSHSPWVVIIYFRLSLCVDALFTLCPLHQHQIPGIDGSSSYWDSESWCWITSTPLEGYPPQILGLWYTCWAAPPCGCSSHLFEAVLTLPCWCPSQLAWPLISHCAVLLCTSWSHLEDSDSALCYGFRT